VLLVSKKKKVVTMHAVLHAAASADPTEPCEVI
jgi:hypothetical protein